MKKLLSVILAIAMLLTTSVCAFAADRCAVDELKFNKDGKFKILMLNDTQEVGQFGNPNMPRTSYISRN